MERIEPLLSRYTELLSRFVLADEDMQREIILDEATELSKTTLADGPAIDQLHELHKQAQAALAERWRHVIAGDLEHTGRERLTRGDSITLLFAMTMPHDLAQRANNEKRWRREHETMVAMFEQTDEIIVVLDQEGQCDDVNPAFCRATGWTQREAASGAGDWPAAPSTSHRIRTSQVRKDGSRFGVEWSVSPILGNRGDVMSLVCIGRDVDRHQKIEESLRENDKLRAIATLAGGIAHDFNNLLGSILGLTELCELEAPEGSRQARNLGRIRQAGDTAAALVRQMLDFSRQTPAKLHDMTMRDWLDHAEGLLRAALPRQVVLDMNLIQDSPVRIDVVQMEQVLLNMVRNAAQAMAGRSGSVHIVADRADPPGSELCVAPGPHHARLRIVDDGDGIPPEVLDKIFEPFFTTKPVGEGTGLGLAAVHGIVTSHGGLIAVESRPGSGTTFSIFLPIATDSIAAG